MNAKDFYDTISEPTEGLYKEKGSKFLAYAYPTLNIEEVEYYLDELKSMHPKSRHICYAYRIGIEGEQFRINDDGEPSGTAGKPIYNEILSKEISNVLLAVVRYFGGTKLGASGLIQAYKTSSREAMQSADIKRVYEKDQVQMQYPMDKMGVMYNLLKSMNIDNIESIYEQKPYMQFDIRKSETSHMIKKITAEYYGYAIEDITEDFESEDLSFKIIPS